MSQDRGQALRGLFCVSLNMSLPCTGSKFRVLIELPFERKGKELYSRDGYLVIKRGLLNFTFKKKRKSQNSSLMENVIITNTGAT